MTKFNLNKIPKCKKLYAREKRNKGKVSDN